MTIKLPVEIRSGYVSEHVSIPARSKNGEELPAIDFDKRFYRAEYDGEMCLLRFDRTVAAPDESWKRGDMVEVACTQFVNQGDVANFTITSGKLLKK